MDTTHETLPEAAAFDTRFLHNFGDLDPIPIGAVALCGAVSTRSGSGEKEPLRRKCCPICLAIIENS